MDEKGAKWHEVIGGTSELITFGNGTDPAGSFI
jgi:hypothetical protein